MSLESARPNIKSVAQDPWVLDYAENYVVQEASNQTVESENVR